MKLKELHIRNIASIESADIDFEHGLNDTCTGTPASIFLISGDTGAGKSVILDGIAMALYKKTPRIADVANATHNDYTDAEGEQIRVASIEQYTRLGISEKDESYSEVVFEGNDGIIYHARLTLGMMLGQKDKETGLRTIKHRSPRWEIKTGDADWTKDSVEKTILGAVGLDFQQFGRMAMLAQGQFANFLTGDKKEREAILEQLTNTQHFTLYGEAIQSLFKKAKAEQERIQTQFDTEKPHTLSEEEVEQLIGQQKADQQQREVLDRHVKALDDRLKLIAQYLLNLQKEAVLAAGLQEEQSKTASLLAIHAEAQAKAQAAEKAVREKEVEIEVLTRKREALHPLAINDQLSRKEAARRQIEDLRKAYEMLASAQKEADALRREIAGEQTTLEALQAKSNSAEAVYQARKAEADRADKRLTTMRMSVNNTIVALRHRLHDEHTETCPLCGQHIDHDHLSDDFRNVLTPLENEQQQAAEALDKATRQRNDARDAFVKFQGAYQGKARQLAQADQKNSRTRQTLDANATALAVSPDASVMDSALQLLVTDIANLKTAQQEAEIVQGIIYTKLRDKKPLDDCKFHAERAKLKAENDVKSNAANILRLTNERTSLMQECETMKALITPAAIAITPVTSAADITILRQQTEAEKATTNSQRDELLAKMAETRSRLETHHTNVRHLKEIEAQLSAARQCFLRWDRLNSIFGGTRFRTLVQTYILRPLLNNANIYLEQITDRYHLTCSEDNEQLSILVQDRYNKNQVRSVTVLSGGERFMISLALSLALSSLNRPDMNVNILFIDEGFGTLDEKSLDSVMSTLEKLQDIAGQTNRRVGIISHREELVERIPVQIKVVKKGEGRSLIHTIT